VQSFTQSLVLGALNGVSYGLLLFMLSAGLTLIFSMLGVLNFAHASFYMLGVRRLFGRGACRLPGGARDRPARRGARRRRARTVALAASVLTDI
jgi:hypothetical protein